MDNIAAVMLILVHFLLSSRAAGAQLVKQQSNNVTLGSSLSPNSNSQLPDSWLSPSGLFAFGFYKQGDGFAIGIWLAGKPTNTVVWTANRDDPPLSSNSTTTLELTSGGLLLRTKLRQQNITDLQYQPAALSASMLDSGNFVIYDNESEAIWASFDHPTDTILGGQNLSSYLFSSVSTSDHSSGRYYLTINYDGKLTAGLVNRSSSVSDDDAYWSLQTSDGRDLVLSLNVHIPNSSGHGNKTIIYRATLDADGNFRLYSHSFDTISGKSIISKTEWSALENECQIKGFCGVNSYCSATAGTMPNCSCFPGFVFLNPNVKSLGCYRTFIDEGCTRKEPKLLYNITALKNVELRGYRYSILHMKYKKDCGQSCLEDCNCWAAQYMGGTCNKHKLPHTYGVLNPNGSATAFIKISFETAQIPDHNPWILRNSKVVEKSNKALILILAVSLVSLALLSSLIATTSFFMYRRRVHRYQKLSTNANLGLQGEFTLRPFSYGELERATDGFKEELGRNSFGAVYKGAISEGKKIVAVKRLERVTEEGERGFRAEITAIGQTHHRNVVRLLGFCIEGTRKLLVYEFINNGSLADLLFKVERRPSWRERVRIALDVARGILYLHEQCEARIIHCNIKPQNVLMDESWTAKISDFGLAKLLLPNQTGTLTRVGGTRGYSAPEWYKNTLITEKADVYSFGVVLLEIVCCCTINMEVDVSNWVYNCFVARELEKLVGDEEVDMKTLERMVKVGWLCIQDDPSLRPSMKNVILMLEGTMDIPVPPSPSATVLAL